MLWIWNTEWEDFARIVFDVDWAESPDHEKQYLSRYQEMWSSNPAQLFSALDYGKMNRITGAAHTKYGDEEQ